MAGLEVADGWLLICSGVVSDLVAHDGMVLGGGVG